MYELSGDHSYNDLAKFGNKNKMIQPNLAIRKQFKLHSNSFDYLLELDVEYDNFFNSKNWEL